MTVSPSGSDVVTVNVLFCPTVALNTESTVMLGLPLAAIMTGISKCLVKQYYKSSQSNMFI